ncbi:MAG TPA: response regulator [Mucilaginibacter sp.]|jgi:two-component system LytT family response regulator|nr:response regulator [Mucilaginibacter sp.]
MNKTWKTLVIDDEEPARQRLKRLLKPFEHIDVIGEAVNGNDGIEQIEQLLPDLIFLDIEMPVFNGFEMLARITHQPKVVFTTAYDQYAIKAFEEGSVDYLLKPVEPERLEKTIKRLEVWQNERTDYTHLATLMQAFRVKNEIKTLTVKIGDKILLIKLDSIVFIEAEDRYVFLHTIDGKKHLTDFTVSSLEEKLSEQFVRIHRGHIINSDYIKEIRRGFNGAFVFVMNDKENTRLTSSRANGDMLRARFDI